MKSRYKDNVYSLSLIFITKFRFLLDFLIALFDHLKYATKTCETFIGRSRLENYLNFNLFICRGCQKKQL